MGVYRRTSRNKLRPHYFWEDQEVVLVLVKLILRDSRLHLSIYRDSPITAQLSL
jgi:hypothetical protein